jgi:hypothetical protein
VASGVFAPGNHKINLAYARAARRHFVHSDLQLRVHQPGLHKL